MSTRVATTPTSQGTAQVQIPQEKIAMRAYERWCKRGRPQGTDKQDWYEAEVELKAEIARAGTSFNQPRR